MRTIVTVALVSALAGAAAGFAAGRAVERDPQTSEAQDAAVLRPAPASTATTRPRVRASNATAARSPNAESGASADDSDGAVAGVRAPQAAAAGAAAPTAAKDPSRVAHERALFEKSSADLTRAREAKDGEGFSRAVEALIRIGSAEALEAVTAVIADPATDLPISFRVGVSVAGLLRTAGAPGLSDAARRRFERELTSARDERDKLAWLRLVGRFGTEEDDAWLLARPAPAEVNPGVWRSGVLQALAEGGRNAADRELLRIWTDRTADTSGFREALRIYVESRKVAAVPLLTKLIRHAYSADVPENLIDESDLMRAYARHLPAPQLGDASALLHANGDLRWRLLSVYAVQTFAQRKLDVAPFADLTALPADVLRRAVAGDAEARAHAGSARYAIEYNEVAWSDAAFDALAAAATLPDMDDAARLAAELRAKHERSW